MYMICAVIIGSIGSIASNFLLVDKFGIMDAAFGTLTGNIIWALMIVLFTIFIRRNGNAGTANFKNEKAKEFLLR
jgi:O-antigen/teichoic acid export membrane protein